MDVTSNVLLGLIKNIQNIDHHHRIINNSVELLKSFPGIEAILLSGSFASDTADVFSDIDLKVAFDHSITSQEAITNGYIEGVGQVGKIVNMFNSHINPKDKIIYFYPFIKFELNIRSIDILSLSWKNAKSKILYQKNGTGNKILENAQAIRHSIENHKKFIQNISIALPHFCYIVMGYVIRGELISAFSDLNRIRGLLLEINGYLLLQENEGPRRAENRYPENVLSYYNKSAVVNEHEIKNALKIILEWYTDILVPALEENGIETKKKLAMEIMELVSKAM